MLLLCFENPMFLSNTLNLRYQIPPFWILKQKIAQFYYQKNNFFNRDVSNKTLFIEYKANFCIPGIVPFQKI